MVDWPTIASLATAAGTLVLAGATFASVRSANRTARAAERSLQEGLRPLVVPTRPEDPPQKVMWHDAHKAMVSGGYAVAEEVDGNIYLAATVRNAGAGIAVLHSWFPHVGRDAAAGGPPPIEDFRRLTRDLYIPAHDNGFWQGAIREPDDPHREVLSQAIAERNLILIDLLYGDHEGGQRTITRFGLTPLDNGSWLTSVSRYWHIDGPSRAEEHPDGAIGCTQGCLLFSVLDLAPVSEGSSPADALNNSIELARTVERLGYARHWVAEHHNMPGIASSAPAVLLAHIASATSTIRVGSGGVMLPNHASLVIAEQFGMLEALHPGRVDLGIGRAPGTDPLTARALRRSDLSFTEDEFPAQLVELIGYFSGRFPDGHPYRHITAVPGLGYAPAMWLLGSSDYSANVAGVLGLPFSFAHHFAARGTDAAVAAYRAAFRPSADLAEPYVMLGVTVVCTDTDEHAEWLSGSNRLAFVRLRSGRPGRFPSPEEAAAYRYSPMEQETARSWTGSHIVGSPERVRKELLELADRTGADELMITTMVHSHADRLRSYELVADVMDLPARS